MSEKVIDKDNCVTLTAYFSKDAIAVGVERAGNPDVTSMVAAISAENILKQALPDVMLLLGATNQMTFTGPSLEDASAQAKIARDIIDSGKKDKE